MKKTTLENKELLNIIETLKFYKLSCRRFYQMLEETPQPPFIIWYHTRRLVIRSEFEFHMRLHPDIFQWIRIDESWGKRGGNKRG